MPKISIVVPVYNSEQYLKQCIESLIGQTISDIEIILVNDGSTDSSLEICEEYAQNDRRIVVISKENEGVAKARRDGIIKAGADYISFLDSDDYYEPEFCERMLSCMIQSGADLVECGYYKVLGDSRSKHCIYSSNLDLSEEAFHNTVVRTSIVNGTEAVVVWNKLYRKTIIQETVRDYGYNQLEDYIFNAQYYTMVKRYCYIHQCLTNYRQLPLSLSRKCNLKAYEILQKAEAIKEICLEKMGLVSENDKKTDAIWFVNYTNRFFQQYLLADVPHSDEFINQILHNETLLDKCRQISQTDTFARLITERNFKGAMRRIKRCAMMQKLRISMSKIKRLFCTNNEKRLPCGKRK